MLPEAQNSENSSQINTMRSFYSAGGSTKLHYRKKRVSTPTKEQMIEKPIPAALQVT
jgi:hypothetical protein